MVRMPLPRPALAALSVAAASTILGAACSPGLDGAWTVIDEGFGPIQLRVVHGDEGDGAWFAGYHEGSLAGILLHGAEGAISAVPLPTDLLWDFTFVDVCWADAGVLWIAASAHLFRLEDEVWEVHPVPAEVAGGVTGCAFASDGAGWVSAQAWGGPRIFAFEGEEFDEEPIDDTVADQDQITLVRLLARGSAGYAAGARRTAPC